MRRRLLIVLAVVIFILVGVPFIVPLPSIGSDPAQFADADGRFITVNGLETYIREAGNPQGEPILLLHGWAASTFSWQATIPALADAGYRVIAFDRPPYGLSQKTGETLPLSPARQAAFTAALMDALDLERATLVGHSMGGSVIGYFAHEMPERVDRLVFVAGALRAAEAQSDQGRSVGIPPLLRSLLMLHPVDWWARLGIRAFIRPDSFESLQRTTYYDPAFLTPERAEGYARALQVENWDQALIPVVTRAFGEDPPLTQEQLRAITIPSLIVWGENDTWVPLSVGAALHDLLPNDALITYPQVGHLPMEEAAAAFNRDVLQFLAETPLTDL
ncbi:MAG: alpha/beta hydrolase [bacterium]|nr:alpha/beta hydrolase [bacterium]